jgi:PadR family transcriptional regulator PadR
VRLTHSVVQVALALSDDPFGEHYGYDLSRRAHVRSGVMYPILRRMLEDGWLTDGWQDPSETNGRPPRRYYTLTDKGRRELGTALETAREDKRFLGLFGWAGT